MNECMIKEVIFPLAYTEHPLVKSWVLDTNPVEGFQLLDRLLLLTDLVF